MAKNQRVRKCFIDLKKGDQINCYSTDPDGKVSTEKLKVKSIQVNKYGVSYTMDKPQHSFTISQELARSCTEMYKGRIAGQNTLTYGVEQGTTREKAPAKSQ